MSAAWPWLALAGLGAFHGLNPAMGWLFAVALGLQRQRRSEVLKALLPIAAGHALSIALVVAVLALLRALIDLRALQFAAAALLIGFGVYRLRVRHRGRAGMQVSSLQLVLWSFLMATAHGAGLMLVPVLLKMPMAPAHEGHAHMAALALAGSSITIALAAIAVHTLAMLGVAGAIALAVYDWFGLAFLRRGWINLDLLWSLALIGAGAILLLVTLAVQT